MAYVMKEFWENYFRDQGTFWGFKSADSSLYAAKMFQAKNYKKVLIPGIGYGRNARPFLDAKMKVAGIEISSTALSLMKDHFPKIQAFCGSVLDMPFEEVCYDGIYCYALLHLFNFHERKIIISNCCKQLNNGGAMIFSVISPESDMMKSGKQIGRNRRLLPNGSKVFFYDDEDIRKEFAKTGLAEIVDMEEPIKFMNDVPSMKFKMIICEKQKQQ